MGDKVPEPLASWKTMGDKVPEPLGSWKFAVDARYQYPAPRD